MEELYPGYECIDCTVTFDDPVDVPLTEPGGKAVVDKDSVFEDW